MTSLSLCISFCTSFQYAKTTLTYWFRLVSAFAEGPMHDYLALHCNNVKKSNIEMGRQIESMQKQLSLSNPEIFRLVMDDTQSVKRSIAIEKLKRLYMKCMTLAKLEWIEEASNRRGQLQEVSFSFHFSMRLGLHCSTHSLQSPFLCQIGIRSEQTNPV